MPLQIHQPLTVTQNCDNCGYPNPSDSTICLNCTVNLHQHCPACKQFVADNSKFCGQCGASLADFQPASQLNSDQEAGVAHNILTRMPSALAKKIRAASVKQPGERRDATILLVDIADFIVNVAGLLDEECIYLLIDEAIALLADVANKYNGTIDKFTGSGLMVHFGVPAAHENDPELAVRTALDMLTAIQPLSQHLKDTVGLQFQLRIGISTGEVIAGRMGSNYHMEYTVIGDSVNLAANLKEAAAPGTILVSSETFQRTNTLFEFEPISPAINANQSDTEQYYRPLKIKEQHDHVRGLSGLQLSLVGRIDELAQLEQVLNTVQTDKQRRIVLLSGEAGIGKSRLVAEFLNKIAPLSVQIYQSACPAYTRAQPLAVVAKMVRRIIGLVETDPASIQHETILHHLKQKNLSLTEVWPYLAHILGLEQVDQASQNRLALLDGSMLQRQSHVALRQLFLAEAQQSPAIFIFDDLQWLDPASSRFLEYLLQTSGDAPVMLVLVSRPVEPGSNLSSLQPALENESDCLVDLLLGPLSVAEQELLVDQFISRNSVDGQTIRQKIIQRGEGNPFYMGELIRMLIDGGGLKQESPDKDWQITTQASELITTIPGTLKGLILARFDRLPEELRRTLQVAAVLGNPFSTSLLQKVRDLSVDTLSIHLKELEIRQFLSSGPEKYEFQHTLFQEVICSTLLKQDLRRVHDQVAQAVEQNEFGNPDEKTELLAHHYFEGTQPVKAIPHLITTAEKATMQSAYEIAVEQYQHVISLLPEQPNGHSREFFQVRLGLGRALKYVGQLSAADQLLTESLPQLWRSGLTAQSATLWPVLVEILRQLADIYQRQGAYGEALDYLETGLQVLGDAGAAENPRLWCRLVERQAWIHFRQGRLEQAFALASSAVQRLDSNGADDPIMLAKLLNTLGGISWQQGNREDAIDYTRRSLEMFRRIGYIWGVATAHNNLGILYDVMGNWTKAVEYHQQAYTLQKNIGDIEGQARSLDSLGNLQMMMGQHETARQKLEASLALRKKLGDRYGMAQAHTSLAELALLQQAHQEALTHGEVALKLADAIKSSDIQVVARLIVARAHVERGEVEPGLPLVKEALTMTREDGFVEGEIDCLRVMGVLQAHGGEYQQAQLQFQNSAQLAQKCKDPYRQGLALLESGRAYLLLGGVNDNTQLNWQVQAEATLDEAYRMFETVGATHYQNLTQATLKQLQSDGSSEG